LILPRKYLIIYRGGCRAAAVGLFKAGGGKSGHHRAGRSLTATGGDPRVRATEKIPPFEEFSSKGKGEKVG